MIKFCQKCQAETERSKRGSCKPCERARTAAWQAANPDKRRASIATYRAANRDKLRADSAAYRAANPEKMRALTAAWEAANPERVRALKAAWFAANPEAKRIADQNRRARQRAAGGKLSPGLTEKLFKLQRGKCACGCKQPLGDDYHMDHRMPLVLGGTNTDDNMQLLRKRCNLKKGAKHPVNFMQQRGFLL